MKLWAGKIAVVTGASAGIGEAIAISLAKNGMTVVGMARSLDKLKRIEAMFGNGNFHSLKCDVQNEKEIIKCFETIESKFGGIDLLVNNAAVLNFASVIEGSTADWKSIYDTNVMGASICTREALKTMRKRGDDGHIININSIAGQNVLQVFRENVGMYTASKFALNAITKSLRIELRNLKSKIKVTSIHPGLVHTAMGDSCGEYLFDAKIVGEIPNGYLSSQDVADSVIQLLSLHPRVEIQELTLQSNVTLF